MNQCSRDRRQAGFTLIEIMVVVIVLAILAATIIPQFTGTAHDARVARAGTDIKTLENALERFYTHVGRYPTTEEGLRSLVEPPSGIEGRWGGPYIKELIQDPWQNEYQYRSPGQHGSITYDLWSRGADGSDGGEAEGEDVTSWRKE